VFVPITGVGHGDPAPDIYAKPGLVAFGTVPLGQGAPSEVLVGNNGPGTLLLGSVRLVGKDASQFTLSAVALEDTTLETGEFDMLSVSVQATQQGPLEAAIEVSSNDGDEDPLLIPLTATADGDPVGKAPIAVCGPTLFSAPTQTACALKGSRWPTGEHWSRSPEVSLSRSRSGRISSMADSRG
jgi:hypothetical protein